MTNMTFSEWHVKVGKDYWGNPGEGMEAAWNTGLEEGRHIRDEEVKRLTVALRRLRAEVAGSLGIAEPEIRQAIGNTNISVLKLRVKEADELLAALDETKGAP